MLALFELIYVSQVSLEMSEIYEKNEKWKLELGSEERASRNFRWREIHAFDMNFDMQGSKISKYYRKTAKNSQKDFFEIFEKLCSFPQNLRKTCLFSSRDPNLRSSPQISAILRKTCAKHAEQQLNKPARKISQAARTICVCMWIVHMRRDLFWLDLFWQAIGCNFG